MRDSRGRPYKLRYVNPIEKADQDAARGALLDLAQESLRRPQATPAARMSPFLRYHGYCTRYGCPCDAGDLAASAARAIVVFNAGLHVYLDARA